MTNEDKVKLLEAFGAAWNAHDVDALMSMMADDCEFHTVAGPDLMGSSHIGREAVRKAYEAAWINIPDASWTDSTHVVTGDRGFTETTFSGTNPDGTRIEARMVDTFTFKGDKILIKNAFRKNRPPLPAK